MCVNNEIRTYSISICVVISISSRKSTAVAAWRLLENVLGTSAPDVVHAVANAIAAVEAWASTPASCVVLVTNRRMPLASFALISAVNPVTFDANFVSATTFPMCALDAGGVSGM